MGLVVVGVWLRNIVDTDVFCWFVVLLIVWVTAAVCLLM